MLEYTITEGESFFQDEFKYNYTYSETYEIGSPCQVCEGEAPEYQGTYETYSTYSQSSNGDWTQSCITKYKDNGPNRCPKYICGEGIETYEIGGNARCNNYELKAYTINLHNGQRTEYYNMFDDEAEGCKTINAKDYPLLWDQPVRDQEILDTTTTQTTKSFYLLTTNGEKRATKLTNDSTYIYQTDYTYNCTINTETFSTKTITVLTTKKGQNRIIGYKNSLGKKYYSSINARDTVIYLTNNNVVWYRTDNKPVYNAKKQISQAFKSIQGIGKSATIKYQVPVLKEANSLIGSYNCSYEDENFENTKLKQEIKTLSSTIQYRTTTVKTSKFSTIDIQYKFPISTVEREYIVSTTSTETVATKFSFNIKNYRTCLKTSRVLQKYNIKVSTLNWDYLKEGEPYEFKTTYKAFYSTHGQCVKDGITRNDAAEYRQLQNTYWVHSPNNGGGFEFHSPIYVAGMASPKNLTSYGVLANLGAKTFQDNLGIGGYIASVIPNIYFPIGPSFFDNWSIPLGYNQGTLNYLISSSIVSSIEHSSTYREEKNILTSTTRYAWELQGQKPTNYFIPQAHFGGNFFDYRIYIHNFYNFYQFSIGDPNELYNGHIFMNIGKYRNDGDQNNPITRVLYPGRYLKIGNTTETYEANNIQYKNVNNDDIRDLYLPLCDEVIGETVYGDLVDGLIHFEHRILEPEILSEALQIGFGRL